MPNKEMFIDQIGYPVLSLHMLDAQREWDEKNDRIAFYHRFLERSKDTAETDLRVVVGEDAGFPFTMEVVVSGIFRVSDYASSDEGLFLMKNTSITVLYPYLRSAVANLCALAGVKPITLPVIDTLSFFGNQTQKKDPVLTEK